MLENINALTTSLDPKIRANDYRLAMRKFAASVTIITTGSGDQLHGMTATAVCSVSAEPPTILVVINRTARTHPLIGNAGFFTVNILAEDQRSLADRFSIKHPNQFEGISHNPSRNTKSPVLSGAAAYLECKLIRQVDVGTHTIFLGEVLHCNPSDANPLLYYEGRYSELALGQRLSQ
jgi:flavin reductase (DIM6/NTAB) family NADH-FMN oxidoreductase RutF